MMIIEGWRVWLRGGYTRKYKTIRELELAQEREAARIAKFNPRLGEWVSKMALIEWLHNGGAILRKERVELRKGGPSEK